jgi:cytochrome o ubiquinol oxidase operon protein cyoD
MDRQAGYRQELRRYRAGLLLAIILTAVPTVLVRWGGLSASATLMWVLALVLIQIAVHLYCFLHIGTQRSSRDELGLILFTAVIVLLMVGGTLLVFIDQMQRMG